MGLIPTPPDDDGHADDRDDDDDDDLLGLPAQPPAALVGEATRQRNILPARKTVQLCASFLGMCISHPLCTSDMLRCCLLQVVLER